jgi:hypothetical protein
MKINLKDIKILPLLIPIVKEIFPEEEKIDNDDIE